MIGLCIGTGTWYRLAKRAAERMESMTGIECRVIDRVDSNLVHPSWHKLNILRDYPGETLFIFDADMWCMKEWSPMHAIGGDQELGELKDECWSGLAMVPEPIIPSVRMESILYHIPLGRYCNTGMIIVDSRAKDVFAAAKKLHPHYGSWIEQTGINHCAHAMKFNVTYMPQCYNTLIPAANHPDMIRGYGATVAHFAGGKTVDRLHELYDALG